TPHGVATSCGAPERAIARLLELLAATGLLARDGDRYRLPPGPAALYERDASAHPMRDSAIFWGRLSQWAATGIPFMEMDRPDGAIYADIVGRVALLEAPAADELADALVERGLVPEGAEILDVGAGSGV